MKAMAKAGVGDGGNGAMRLEDVAKQFKHWRELRVRGEHIPAALWEEAVRLCQEHVPQQVAGVLRVSLAGLTRRMERDGDRAAHDPGLDTEFVEVLMSTTTPEPAASKLELAPPPKQPSGAPPPPQMPECVFEMENARGAKMRVALNGAGLASLGALYSAFWSAP